MYNSNFIRESNNILYQKKSSNKYINQIMIPQKVLDDIISSLELIINRINQDQDKYYIIEGLLLSQKYLQIYINIIRRNNLEII